MENNTILEVVCALIWQDRKLLATRRNYGTYRERKWEFPGGKIEKEESRAEAIVREIREELGISIQALKELPSVIYRYPDKTIKLIPLVCRWLEGEIKLRDHEEMKWLSPGELLFLDWSEADKNLIILLTEISMLNGGDIV